MKAVLQRVRSARVEVDGQTVGQINHGLLVLVCAERGDTDAQADKVLVRGYEVRERLTVGQPVQVAFIADRVGTFEIVPEDTGTVLTRVVVG